MLKIRIAAVMACAVLLLGGPGIASADRRSVDQRSTDQWKLQPYSGPWPTHCLMKLGSHERGQLFGYFATNGLFQLGFSSNRIMPTDADEPELSLWFDGVSAPLESVTTLSAEAVLFQGLGAAEEEDSLIVLVETGRSLAVRGRGVDRTFQLDQLREAVRALRDCEAQNKESGGSDAEVTADGPKLVPPWLIIINETKLDAKCVMLHTKAEEGKFLFGYFHRGGRFRLGLSSDTFDFVQTVNQPPKVIIDGKEIEITTELNPDRNNLLIMGGSNGHEADLLPTFEGAKSLEIRASFFDTRHDLGSTAAAIEALRRCDESRTPASNASDDTNTAAADEADRNQRVAGSDGGDVSGQGSTPSSPSEKTDAAQRLSQALHGMGSQAPTLAQFQCEINTAQLYGILTPGSQDRTSVITLNVAEDGVGVINGGSFQPAYRDGGPASGDIRSLAYSVKDIIAATSPAPEHVAPPLINMTDSEMAAFRAAMGYMQGAGDMMLAGRERYMMVSLADDVVHLFDLTPQNEAVNIATLRCVRTM